MRPRTLLALLLVVPLVDALFLIVVATRLGWAVTVTLVVLTAVLGMLLLRAEGRATLARIQRKLARGSPPTDELLDGGLLIAAGAFLLTPGLVTDAVGFLLALPLSRVPIRMALKKYVVVPYLERETDGFFSGNVYVGGFPGDGEGGFSMGGGFPGGPGGDPGGFDGGSGTDADESVAGNAGSGGASTDDDVVDVDFTVEEEERKGSD
ncbi:FxsA family protein [Halorubrum ezzemoulense]|uniref:FxsA family protein n=1 Tax=Halorubrum ezzemoulense TaxID=337243 RepID=UPI00232C09AD|nr:FxsA family protein [Halorubrum ezzemoulense]MDB2237367.1 membrane protein FxsA [Halorubrum ezzemoulense]MDB2246683.1 membrane protein FxsA [Halorubrum ezzemoulense]